MLTNTQQLVNVFNRCYDLTDNADNCTQTLAAKTIASNITRCGLDRFEQFITKIRREIHNSYGKETPEQRLLRCLQRAKAELEAGY